jgi:sulfatase maturation enzyme AslB (radical SAM superfamily)
MEILLTPEQWTLDLYPINKTSENYKLSNFIIKTEFDNEILLLHTITWSIYALSKSEYENILANKTLIDNKIVIPDDLDEYTVANNVYLIRMTKPTLPTYDNIAGCVILTTTSCNARCAYCYEKTIEKKETMSLETAENIVQFIDNRRIKNKPFKIQWFGGEPLLNKPVIEYITKRLYELNIPFSNSMISNGYLLNEDTVNKLNDWKIRTIQITLDGINEEYNNAKNYVYSDVDAYMTVINNMHNVLNNTKTTITIRFNASNNNIFKLFDEIQYLKDEFKTHYGKKLNFYVAPLFEYKHNPETAVNGYWDELKRISTLVKVATLDKCDDELEIETFKRHPIYKMCMAYNATSIAIMPNGKFTPCEHVKDEDIFGNVIDGVTNKSVIEKWQNFDTEEINYCKSSNCPLHPMCPKFHLCDSSSICVKDTQKSIRLEKAIEKLIRTRKYYNEQINK